MTHDELVKLAARWLRIRKRHPVVLEDVRCFATSEQPDVIGWTNAGFSTLIEAKVSPSDALRDEHKTFRKQPSRGMGYERIFAFPAGFMSRYPSVVNHLPGGWGIVEFDDKGRAKVIRKGTPFFERNDRAERALLVQGVRKATEGWGRKTFGDLAPEMTDGDPHPTASKVIRDLRIENRKLRDQLARERRGGSALRLPNTRIEKELYENRPRLERGALEAKPTPAALKRS